MSNTINIEHLPAAVLGYFQKYMLPHIAENMRFWYLLGAQAVIPAKIAEFTPMINDSGMVDEAGNIDLDKLQKLAEETFKQIPKAYVGKFDFNAGDLPQFIMFLKNGNQQ